MPSPLTDRPSDAASHKRRSPCCADEARRYLAADTPATYTVVERLDRPGNRADGIRAALAAPVASADGAHRHTDDCYGEIDGRLICPRPAIEAAIRADTPALDVKLLAVAIDEAGLVTWDGDPREMRHKTATEIAVDAAPRYARLRSADAPEGGGT